MGRKLATYVHVGGKRYGPDDEIPDEVAARITNPKVWAAPEQGGVEPSAAAAKRGGTRDGRRLATYVHVGGRSYGPDDEIPDEVAARITNPKVWEGGALPLARGGVIEGPGSADDDRVPFHFGSGFVLPASAVATNSADEPEQVLTDEPAQDGDGSSVPVPPRTGKGSGVAAWSAFAAAHGVQVEDGASRDDIIAACEQADLLGG